MKLSPINGVMDYPMEGGALLKFALWISKDSLEDDLRYT
jgi:hypothetical protein